MSDFKTLWLIICAVLAFGGFNTTIAQEIDFGDYSSTYSVTVDHLSFGEELDFGTLIQNDVASIPISNAVVLTIEGVKYLDVIVTVDADSYLLLNGNIACETDPNCRIDYTLQAAYANRGNNNTSQAYTMSVLSNTATAQFPIKYRGNAPPGPPPTPVYQGYNAALFNETAYLYIFGSVTVGAINAGTYTGNVSITVNYD